MCNMSCVTCHLSHVMSHMSRVTCHMSHFFFFSVKVLEPVDGGSVINEANPRLVFIFFYFFYVPLLILYIFHPFLGVTSGADGSIHSFTLCIDPKPCNNFIRVPDHTFFD